MIYKRRIATAAFKSYRRRVAILCVVMTVFLFSGCLQLSGNEKLQIRPWLADHVPLSRVADRGSSGAPAYRPDFLSEEAALALPACTDPDTAASLTHSRIALKKNWTNTFALGEAILVKIQLFDGYNKPLSTGGAILRGRMFNTAEHAYAPAQVIDHGDGSYTARFEALWTGEASIRVKIAYTPEMIRGMYLIRHVTQGAWNLDGAFENGPYSEVTFCHPNSTAPRLRKYRQLCNLTHENSDMPWYCGKPANVHLLCEDWVGIRKRELDPDLPVTQCEVILLKRFGMDITTTLNVKVTGPPSSRIPPPAMACRDFNVTSLWTRREPTGFMYRNHWHLRHCQERVVSGLPPALRNTTLLIFGDSTTRQWYSAIMDEWNCKQTTEDWTVGNWIKPSTCVIARKNFTAHWFTHNLPYFTHGTNRYCKVSISRRLDAIGSHDKVVVVFHIYTHVIAYHHRIFRDMIRNTRCSVERLLERNKQAVVMVKGPHTYFYPPGGKLGCNDFYALVTRQILYEEFAGLHDKVVYLDNSDATVAVATEDYHPNGVAVSGMVNMMASYLG